MRTANVERKPESPNGEPQYLGQLNEAGDYEREVLVRLDRTSALLVSASDWLAFV